MRPLILRCLVFLGIFSLPAGIFLRAGAAAAESAESDPAAIESRIAGSPSLNDLLTAAYAASPDVYAAKASWRASIQKYRVETGYPDPTLSTMYYPDDPSRNWANKRVETLFSQTIPFPGKLAAAGRVVESESRIARLELDRTVRDLSVKVRQSYYELQYIREAMRIAEQNQSAIEHLKKIGETAYSGNRTALYDVLKAQSQSGQVQYDRLLLADLEQNEIAHLNALMDRPPDAPVGPLKDEPVAPLAYDLKAIYGLAENNRQEIREAAAGTDKSRAEADVARYQTLPEFMVGFKYEYDAPPVPDAAATDLYGFQVGLSLPIWWGKNAGRREAARAETEKAAALVKARINETHDAVREAFFRVKNAERLVTLYRDQLLPQAKKSMETAEIWQREGQGSFSDFVETEAAWYNFQLALARSKADYGKYLAGLEGIVGVSLTKPPQSETHPPKPEAAP